MIKRLWLVKIFTIIGLNGRSQPCHFPVIVRHSFQFSDNLSRLHCFQIIIIKEVVCRTSRSCIFFSTISDVTVLIFLAIIPKNLLKAFWKITLKNAKEVNHYLRSVCRTSNTKINIHNGGKSGNSHLSLYFMYFK